VGAIVVDVTPVLSGSAGAGAASGRELCSGPDELEAPQLPPGFVGGEVSGLAEPSFG
jgi:hypothetical protein